MRGGVCQCDHPAASTWLTPGCCLRCNGRISDPSEPAAPEGLLEFLQGAEQHGGTPDGHFADRAVQRFVAAAAEYGDSWRRRPPHELVAEGWEESVDIGGWLGLFALAEPELAHEALAICAEAAVLSERIRRLYGRARHGI